jgi:thiamine biosynthesis lipoprotein
MNTATAKQKLKAHHYTLKLMGCKFTLTSIHKNPDIAWNGIRAGVDEILRLEALISSWKEDSQTGQINRHAGISPVSVDKELFQLITRCNRVSELTKGAFDISGTLSRYYWNFKGLESDFPSPYKINELRDLMNYNNIILNEEKQTVFLAKKGMKIGFGAIGKGYAALLAKIAMEKEGIQNGLVNASGDLLCWGKPIDDKPWNIKIQHPEKRDLVLADLHFENGSVVTSGGYENFALIKGKKYSHIIDPRTGFTVEGLKSVSVVCPNPELGDALATALSVMGAEKGIELILFLRPLMLI